MFAAATADYEDSLGQTVFQPDFFAGHGGLLGRKRIYETHKTNV